MNEIRYNKNSTCYGFQRQSEAKAALLDIIRRHRADCVQWGILPPSKKHPGYIWASVRHADDPCPFRDMPSHNSGLCSTITAQMYISKFAKKSGLRSLASFAEDLRSSDISTASPATPDGSAP